MTKTKSYAKPICLLIALTLALSLSLVAVPMVGTVDASPDDWYVATTGSDTTGDGSEGNPWRTINHAIGKASAGDTINVAVGTYQENLAAWKDMEITKSLTLVGAGSGATVVELTKGKSNGVEIRQTAYDPGNPLDVTIEGMTFTKESGKTDASKRGFKIGETKSAINTLTLRDVEVSYAEVNNIEICGPSTISVLTIENSSFHDAGSHGLMAPGDILSGTITNTHFDNNGRLDVWASGMHIFGLTSNLLVTGCSMSNNTDSGFNGRQLTNVTIKDVVASNNTHANGGGGICISEKTGSSTHITLANITAENNGRDGILIWTWYSYCSISDVTITGGLFTNNGWAGIRVLNWPASGTTGGTIDNVTVTYAQIENNPDRGVHFDLDYKSSNATSSHVCCNNIKGNANWGVLNSGTGTLDGTNNWWNSFSGPSTSPGTGDRVSANVAYKPWLPMKFQYCEECGGGPPPIGGTAYPINKVSLIAPWMALAALLAGSVGWYALRRHRAQN